jgi:uncharacterized membrane protein YdbT with pleckstrin-like domain
LSTDKKEDASPPTWTGRPWILPAAITRTILVLIAAIVIIWFENLANVAGSIILGMSLWMWTALLFLIAWLISFVQLLLLRAAHKYTLRNDGLEVKTGITSLQTFVLAPSGFSDLEVDQSLVGRMLGYGDITIHTQSERTTTMQKVKNPVKVADQIRKIMGKPIVRIEGQPPT